MIISLKKKRWHIQAKDKKKLIGLKRVRTSVESINSTSLKPLSHKTFVLVGSLLI
jgi:hypothetical protein